MAGGEFTRPGFVHEVTQKDRPTLVPHGESFHLIELPEDTRVIYPPEPLPPLPDPDAAIHHALLHPVGDMEPLPALLRPGMRLTIAFHDASAPLPAMQKPDNRQRVIEAVLEMAFEAGVDDVKLVISRGLRRKMTEEEQRHALGDRVYEAFAPHGLIKQHDAEDQSNLVVVGTSYETGNVAINRRVAESDLLVNIGINTVGVDGGYSTVVNGLTSYSTFHDSFWNKNATQSTATERVLAESGPKVFQIETTLNTNIFPQNLAFLHKREWEWTLKDKAAFGVSQRVLDRLSPGLERQIAHSVKSPVQMTSMQTGEPEAVHEVTRQKLREQHLVEIPGGPTDILSMGLPDRSPYSVGSIMNPILVQALGLGYFFDVLGKPLVREGGVVIMSHPTYPEFDDERHPSYRDFFEEVLSDTTDPFAIIARYHEKYAGDPHYKDTYQNGSGFHGAHPIFTWSAGAFAAMRHNLSGVIVVGGDPEAVERMGFRSASTFNDALEMAEDALGSRNPSVTHVHSPPGILAERIS